MRIGSWSRYGIIPRISSRPKIYSYADAGEAVLVRYLLDQKISTKHIREIVENLREKYGQWPLAPLRLDMTGHSLLSMKAAVSTSPRSMPSIK